MLENANVDALNGGFIKQTNQYYGTHCDPDPTHPYPCLSPLDRKHIQVAQCVSTQQDVLLPTSCPIDIHPFPM